MSKITTLYSNKWQSIREKTLDNGAKYVYASADWCGSQGVAVLPYRKTGERNTDVQFLGRYEICPAHSDVVELCSITGGMDKENESPVFTAMRELIEEGGYEVNVEDMHYLGTVRPSKASDNTTHLFAVCLDNAKEVEAIGDGTLGEEGAFCGWIDPEQLAMAKDPLLHSMFTRAVYKGVL
jgi:NUDIX domain